MTNDTQAESTPTGRENHAKTIRAWLSANPGATHREAALALGMTPPRAYRRIAVMVDDGLLRWEQTDESEDRRYFVAREVIKPFALEPGEASRRQKEREAKRNRERKSTRVKARPNVDNLLARSYARPVEAPCPIAQTVDEWLQRGGVMEVLPVRWAA